MKLLIDRMLSDRLEGLLETHFPGTQHIDRFLETNAGDSEIWDFAKKNGFTIVTKDADFRQLSANQGWPPKVLKLNIGNCSNEEVTGLLVGRKQEILDFHLDDDVGLLEL